MTTLRTATQWTVAATLLIGLAATTVHAQGKIVCWKDAAGKVIGCGDKVPLEFLDSGTRVLDKQGNVRKTGESAEEVAKRRALEKEQAATKAEEQKRAQEQKRQDTALLNTFTNEKEIDLKRDRELQALNNFLTQQNAALKVSVDKLAETRKRAAGYEKDKKPLPAMLKEDLARTEREKAQVEAEIAKNEKSKVDVTAQYAEYRKRFIELKGTSTTSAPVAATTAPAKK